MKQIKCLLLLILLFNLQSSAQSTSSVKVRSIGYGFGFFGTEGGDGGLSGILELTVAENKNLFLVNYLAGSAVVIFGPSISVNELNLQYGREFKASNWFSVECYAGVGYFQQEKSGRYTSETLYSGASVPLRFKMIFYTGKHFALVSNSNMSINSFGTNYSSNLTFQHHF